MATMTYQDKAAVIEFKDGTKETVSLEGADLIEMMRDDQFSVQVAWQCSRYDRELCDIVSRIQDEAPGDQFPFAEAVEVRKLELVG